MKKILPLCLFAALTLLTLHSCQSDEKRKEESDNQEVNTKQETPVKMIEYLIGEWEVDSVAGGSADANQGIPETLTFTEEARYIVRSGDQKVDSGAYRMNEQLRNLYLESEINEKPREYEIEIKRDTMILSLRQNNQQAGEAKYIYLRRN
jgi:hypothetical protein